MNAFRAWWYRLFNDPEPYHPLFAEAPDPDPVARHYEETGIAFEPQRTVPFIASDHPSDCGDACCWEIRLDELHEAYDWDAAEQNLRTAHEPKRAPEVSE